MPIGGSKRQGGGTAHPPRAHLAAFTAGVAALGLCGFSIQQTPLQFNPGHYENNDPAWTLLNEAAVTLDNRKGEYKAAFPSDLMTLQEKPFTISGFMLPLGPATQSAHFALVRRNTACPFCPPNTPTEAIEIFSPSLVKYTGEEVSVTGRLTLVASSSMGLFYRLDDARVTVNG
jgi:hypothetical protein